MVGTNEGEEKSGAGPLSLLYPMLILHLSHRYLSLGPLLCSYLGLIFVGICGSMLFSLLHTFYVDLMRWCGFSSHPTMLTIAPWKALIVMLVAAANLLPQTAARLPTTLFIATTGSKTSLVSHGDVAGTNRRLRGLLPHCSRT